MNDETYLGDGVYASFDGYQIWLRTGDGNNQRIALEPAVLLALDEYRRVLCKGDPRHKAWGKKMNRWDEGWECPACHQRRGPSGEDPRGRTRAWGTYQGYNSRAADTEEKVLLRGTYTLKTGCGWQSRCTK